MSASDSRKTSPGAGSTKALFARTLGGILGHEPGPGAVRRADLRWGDQVIVRTRNSVYTLWATENGGFTVAGGWFDRHSGSPAEVCVNGCTYGGSVLLHDLVAAPGLFLEFSNKVSTTRIQSVRVVRHRLESGDGGSGPLPC